MIINQLFSLIITACKYLLETEILNGYFLVFQVEAKDIDEGENAHITYSIYHVSNNGGNKFTIDPSTGVICKLTFIILSSNFKVQSVNRNRNHARIWGLLIQLK